MRTFFNSITLRDCRKSTELQKLKGGFDCNLGDFPADVLSNSCRTQREYMGDNQVIKPNTLISNIWW
jgi:hypothetical protein